MARRWDRLWRAVGTLVLALSLGAAPLAAAPASTRAPGAATTEVVVHYARTDGLYSGWDVWLWPHRPASLAGAGYAFSGKDAFGAVADARVPGSPREIGLIVRQGGNAWTAKDVSQDRFIAVRNGRAEVWLIQGDPTLYATSRAAMAARHPTLVPTPRQTTEVIVHYARRAGDYAGWNLWLWPHRPASLAGASYAFSGKDAFGVVADAHVAGSPGEVGLIVRQGEWKAKDVSQDRFVETGGGKAEVWLVQGNPTIFATQAAAQAALHAGILDASLEDMTTVMADLSPGVHLSGVDGGFTATDVTAGRRLRILHARSLSPSGDAVVLTLAMTPDVSHTLTLARAGAGSTTIQPRGILDMPAYVYPGDDLGATPSPAGTTFRVWAPTASSVSVLLSPTEDGPLRQRVAMARGARGTWFVRLPVNLARWYYLYSVTVGGLTQTAVDPYARALAVNATRGMIVDLAATDPPAWALDRHRTPAHPQDAVIYETHVRDFSIAPTSGMRHRGQYLAFTERGTKGPGGVSTGVDHLRELGITAVHLLPTQEFASLDETQKGGYNWGYDPRNYNVPEGAYATTPHGATRITEYKTLVQGLHSAGLGVIMDVVYNHTFTTGSSDFDKIVPRYYYRTDAQGTYANGSGVGNEVAAERPMARKFIVDSLVYWVRQYHVDGFRFDLMALLSVETMKVVSETLHRLVPGILLYGEPWTGGTSTLPPQDLLTKGQQQGLHVAVFNDNLRNALEGNVFQATQRGFATGSFQDAPAVRAGVVGSIAYDATTSDFAAAPEESINYVSSHDNLTLWDRIASSNATESPATRIARDELAQAIVLTAQGVPFLAGGEELLRTKGGNNNSYNAGDAVNALDWARKARFPQVMAYYAGLIHLRLAHPAFRLTSAAQVRRSLTFLKSPAGTLGFALGDHANGDPWRTIVVLYNPGLTAAHVGLPPGSWSVVGTAGRIGQTPLGHASGSVEVAPVSCSVLYQS